MSKRWNFAVAAAFGAALLIAIGFTIREALFTSVEPFGKIAAHLSRTDAARREVAAGSEIVLHDERVARLNTVAGVRLNSERPDSFFVFAGTFVSSTAAQRVQFEAQLVALVAPVRDWDAPIRIELVRATDVRRGTARLGTLALEPPRNEFALVVAR